MKAEQAERLIKTLHALRVDVSNWGFGIFVAIIFHGCVSR